MSGARLLPTLWMSSTTLPLCVHDSKPTVFSKLVFSLRNMQRPFLSFKTLSAGRRRKKTSYENKNISCPSVGRVDPPRAQIAVILGTAKNYDKPFSILHSSPDLLEEYFYITKYNTFNPKDDSSLQNTGGFRTSTQV